MTKTFLIASTACLFFSLILAAAIPANAQKIPRKPRSPKSVVQKQTIILKDGEYRPASFRLKRGVPAQLIIIRKSADECGEEIVFPAYGIRRWLPLNRAVTVRFTPAKKGAFGFMCGMDMMYGKIIVQ
jgi:plastocyanin domain-containing protein